MSTAPLSRSRSIAAADFLAGKREERGREAAQRAEPETTGFAREEQEEREAKSRGDGITVSMNTIDELKERQHKRPKPLVRDLKKNLLFTNLKMRCVPKHGN